MRTVKLHIDNEQLTELMKLIDVKHSVIHAVFGRLSMWGFGSYPVVDIYHDGDADFVAVYREETGSPPRFTIGAVWHKEDKEYGFHS
jgi:hypothetical protein